MPRVNPLIALIFLLSSSCAAHSATQQKPVAVSPSSSSCDPMAPGALVARPSDVKTTPRGHILVAASTLSLVEAKYVEGPCADQIVSFVAGNARLKSGKIFVVRDNGTVKLFPPQGMVEGQDLPKVKIDGLPGYNLVRTAGLGRRRSPAGERIIYLGLFKGSSDSVIARFDVLNGKPSKEAEILVRSRSPITAISFLGAPDTPEGSIGFVERVGKGAAWLYAYSWQHGPFQPLKF